MVWLEAVRDVAILLLALESLVLGVLLAIMLVQLRRLVQLLRDEIAPILDSANDTARTVHGTANLVSQTVVEPLVKARSYAAGTREAFRSLLAIRRSMKRDVSASANGGAETTNEGEG